MTSKFMVSLQPKSWQTKYTFDLIKKIFAYIMNQKISCLKSVALSKQTNLQFLFLVNSNIKVVWVTIVLKLQDCKFQSNNYVSIFHVLIRVRIG